LIGVTAGIALSRKDTGISDASIGALMRIISRSVQDTLHIGRAIAKNMRKGDIICLRGNLGSGKTVLAKGIAEGLGIRRSNVISPSFVLLRVHGQGRFPLYHFDLYRLVDPEDILALGYEEYLYGEGVAVIEWADRLSYLAPPECMQVELSFREDSKRLLKFKANGSRYQQLLKDAHESRTFKKFN